MDLFSKEAVEIRRRSRAMVNGQRAAAGLELEQPPWVVVVARGGAFIGVVGPFSDELTARRWAKGLKTKPEADWTWTAEEVLPTSFVGSTVGTSPPA